MIAVAEIPKGYQHRYIQYKNAGGTVKEFQYLAPWADTKANRDKGLDPDMCFKVGDSKPNDKLVEVGDAKLKYSDVKKQLKKTLFNKDLQPTEATLAEFIDKLESKNYMLIKTQRNASTNTAGRSRKVDLS